MGLLLKKTGRNLAARAALIAALACSAGCVNTMLTKAIVQAPNERGLPHALRPDKAATLAKEDRTYSEAWMLPVGPPAAKLAVAVIEPGDYGLTHEIKVGQFKNGKAPVWPQTDWTLPAKPLPGNPPPKGTILILHGYSDCKEDMMHWALYLAQARYRVVLVDLRGHGRSTGDWIGFGAFEVRDLQQLLDDLEKRGLLQGKVGVFGLSYGASVALQLAGHDPRVGTVVAMEPFSDARRAVVEFSHAVVPKLVEGWTPEDYTRAEDRAGRMAHFSWESDDVLASAARTDAPILYVYATDDHWISPENSKALAAATRSLHSVMVIHFDEHWMESHVRLSWTLDPIAAPIVSWVDQTLRRPGPGLKDRLTSLGFLDKQAPAAGPIVTPP